MIAEIIAVLLGVLIVWEAVWKGIALWKSAKNNQLGWFVAVFVLNTIGVLPIIYLLFFQKNKKVNKKKK